MDGPMKQSLAPDGWLTIRESGEQDTFNLVQYENSLLNSTGQIQKYVGSNAEIE